MSKRIKKSIKSNTGEINFCYLLQRLDKMEENFYTELGKQDETTRKIVEPLTFRLEKIEHEIIGVQKAMTIFIWFAKIVGGIASILTVAWKLFQWFGPKAGK